MTHQPFNRESCLSQPDLNNQPHRIPWRDNLMAKKKTDDNRRSDQEAQQGPNIEKMRQAYNRDTPNAPVAGSKDDREPESQPDKLSGPLHDQEKRSGTHTDQ